MLNVTVPLPLLAVEPVTDIQVELLVANHLQRGGAVTDTELASVPDAGAETFLALTV
ncbi:MAG TPA: hypothetical protein VLN59_11780 [Burkholderiales bacterium]|nr:hypothetical protein [Burkholderiales bacterium]